MTTRREPDDQGLPPSGRRVSSPYDTDARWAAKGEDLFWCGYKLHVTETCDDADESHGGAGRQTAAQGSAGPRLITHVATTAATVPDVAMTTPIHQGLARSGLLPSEHYVDAGYPSAEVIHQARHRFGLTLVTPALADTSAQARTGAGFDKTAFTVDWAARQVTCPQGHTSAYWHPERQRGAAAIVVTFSDRDCHPLCLSSSGG